MEVALRPVTRDNWMECLSLAVTHDQRDMVATNIYSLAESAVDDSLAPRAVYQGEQMVGFAMYGQDPADGRHWVVRLMIDARQQGRGYGRAALLAVFAELVALGATGEVFISCKPGNGRAIGLYESCGFNLTGQVLDGEVVFARALP